MRQPLVVANWKMNGSLQANQALLDGIKQGVANVEKARVAICPPAVYLAQVNDSLTGSPILWGAQNTSEHEKGAYTGEVAVNMLADVACTYVIIGHSERRSLYAESSELVAEKFAAVQKGGLTPILCVGETLTEREADQAEAVIAEQIDAVLTTQGVSALKNSVIAYEPVWAIGTGKTASPEQAQAMHAFIRARIAEHDATIAENLQLLYGGSVKPNNAAELFAMTDIDGGLIGGAALVADDFLAICQAAR